MNRTLSAYVSAIAAKTLSEVECSTLASNQHELNGVSALKRIFGPARQKDLPARMLRIGDESSETDEARLTWYDAREANPRRSEYRLYFTKNRVIDASNSGDTLVIAKSNTGEWIIIVAESGSTPQNQLRWLLDLHDQPGGPFSLFDLDGGGPQIDFLQSLVLEDLGFAALPPADDSLYELVRPFGATFPPAAELSRLARESLPDVDARAAPDDALIRWMEREESLFRELEKTIVARRLDEGFDAEGVADVDAFVSYSLSVQNRRKARSGLALENHVAWILAQNEVTFTANSHTEGRKSPDFVFPDTAAYHNPAFPADKLRMLGAKTSCKERWRQVLSEARRIETKHLLTLEPGISREQTDEMRQSNLQLVVPSSIHPSFAPSQRDWLHSLADFISELKSLGYDPSTSLQLF